jgi:isopentenyl diphosphate isomerase/L-lactate dehydrogenase-like FMN-dependent dehydrogenase
VPFKFKWKNTAPPVSVEGWRRLAKKRLPSMAWSYIESAGDDLITLRDNAAGFEAWRLRQRCLSGIRRPDLKATMARESVSMPVALAPTGMMGLSHWTADVAAARAAERAGTRAVISTASNYSVEEIADATEQKHWFQLYPWGDRERVGVLIKRASDAGYTAMFVTVDVPAVGNREAERTAGLAQPWTLTPRRIMDMARHPAWLFNLLYRRRIVLSHYLDRDSVRGIKKLAGPGEKAIAAAEAFGRYMQADLHWDDLAWIRARWRGPLYVKGILDPDDAARAVDNIGVEGIVVSNHGGRQLDRAPASIDALPAIIERVGNRAEVYLDSGIRRGTDVVIAICLGAKGVFIGRPYLYGLAGAGEQGVSAILDIFRSEIERTLLLMGCRSITALDRSWLLTGKSRANPHSSLISRTDALV